MVDRRLKRRFRPAGIAVAVATGLIAGCTGVEPAFVLMSGATATVVNNNKLPTDFIGDAVTGLDCNSIRQSREGGPYCRSAQAGLVIERPKYCYRSIADITCYDEPDPYRDGKALVQ